MLIAIYTLILYKTINIIFNKKKLSFFLILREISIKILKYLCFTEMSDFKRQ